METVLMIPGELESLENLVKLARRKKDSETTENQVLVVSESSLLRGICVSKMHRNKTLHLPIEISDCIIEGLVNTRASMSVFAAAVVRELGIMHLVTGNKSYKTASGVVTRAQGRVDEVQVKIGRVNCAMTFMVVDTDGYDVLLGLDFLMKIGAVVDVERGMIQIRHGPGTQVEVLPLTVVNLLQRVSAGQSGHGRAVSVEEVPTDLSYEVEADQDQRAVKGEEDESVSDEESDDDEFHDSESSLLEQTDSDDEFVDPEFEELINSEGPQGMLQLMLQEQTDEIMIEENLDGDDYADWIKWSSDAERNRLSECKSTHNTIGTVLVQQHKPDQNFMIPAILQAAQLGNDQHDRKPGEGHASYSHSKSEDFSFKIVHRLGLRHTNADALSRNPVGLAVEDEDFGEEIRDITNTHLGALEARTELLCALAGKDMEWMGIRRKDRRRVQHNAYCFGINHQTGGYSHQLFMLGVESTEEDLVESVPDGEVALAYDTPLRENEEQRTLRKRPRYYDKKQQMELVLVAQELSEFGDPELSPAEIDEEEESGVRSNYADIWQDEECLRLIREGTMSDVVDPDMCMRIHKRANNYCWKEQQLFFKKLLVPEPEERLPLVRQMHEDIGHFGEQRTLVEVRRRYFWHS
ncbi:unnamed protein product [Sphagnum troendelagicum]|uniref:Integrase zinc-binding domain-containing protein n=1 Tax=Sphagnum troendelagicum TaxID=128251 RepID=A0ABP0U6F7_9BRYO